MEKRLYFPAGNVDLLSLLPTNSAVVSSHITARPPQFPGTNVRWYAAAATAKARSDKRAHRALESTACVFPRQWPLKCGKFSLHWNPYWKNMWKVILITGFIHRFCGKIRKSTNIHLWSSNVARTSLIWGGVIGDHWTLQIKPSIDLTKPLYIIYHIIISWWLSDLAVRRPY